MGMDQGSSDRGALIFNVPIGIFPAGQTLLCVACTITSSPVTHLLGAITHRVGAAHPSGQRDTAGSSLASIPI